MGMSRAASYCLRSGRGAAATHPETTHEVKKKQEWANQGFGDQQTLNGFQLTVAFLWLCVRQVGGPGRRKGQSERVWKEKRDRALLKVCPTNIVLDVFGFFAVVFL
jgi:hypothetical protein